MNIQSFIKNLEKEFDDIAPGTVKPESAVKDVLDLNSINLLVLITMIEYEYKTILLPDDVKSVSTIEELVELIMLKTKN